MPINLELKLKVENHTDFINKLNEIKAEFIFKHNQTDTYFVCSKGLLKLREEEDKKSLILYNREEKKNAERWSEYSVLDIMSNNAKEFFTKLYEIETVVEKQRTLYMYANTRIHLDEVKDLGFFLELETLVLYGKADALSKFEEIKKLLDLNKYAEIKKSYRDLIRGK